MKLIFHLYSLKTGYAAITKKYIIMYIYFFPELFERILNFNSTEDELIQHNAEDNHMGKF